MYFSLSNGTSFEAIVIFWENQLWWVLQYSGAYNEQTKIQDQNYEIALF